MERWRATSSLEGMLFPDTSGSELFHHLLALWLDKSM